MATVRTINPKVPSIKLTLRGSRRATVSLLKPGDAAPIFRDRIGRQHVEVLGVLLLDTRFGVIGFYEVARGTINATGATPADILVSAILANAPYFVICHNHPSGEVTPSAEDVAVCRRVLQAAQLLGVTMLDFMIVTSHAEYFSFSEKGTL